MGALTSFFLNPIFLLGTLTAAIPVIIHLIYRRRAPEFVFSTLRFLRMAAKRTSRRRKIQNLLLLLLRVALLFLFAIALAQPFFRAGASVWKGQPSVAFVIVLDNSYSMDVRGRGESCLSVAKKIAQQIVKHAGKSDFGALILTNGVTSKEQGHVRPYETLTNDLEAVFEGAAACEVSPEVGDLWSAVRRAKELLDKSHEPYREIYILTDLQKFPWKISSPLKGIGPGISVFIVDCGKPDVENRAVTAIKLESRGSVARIPFNVRATILNDGTQPASNVNVSVYLDERKVDQQRVDISPSGSAEVVFTCSVPKPGPHVGWVQIETEDALPLDNRRYFAVNARDRLRALLVKDKNSGARILDEAFYLHMALQPPASNENDVSPIEAVERLTTEVEKERLSEYDVVYLLNVAEITPDFADRLMSYVLTGGCVVIYPGEAVKPSTYEKVMNLAPKGLLPAQLQVPVGSIGSEEFLRVTKLNIKHPLLTVFSEMPASVAASILVYRYFPLVGLSQTHADAVMSMSNGAPFLVVQRVGRGFVCLFSVPATARWTNFPICNLFLPLNHQIVYYAASLAGTTGENLAGRPVYLNVREGVTGEAQVEVTCPSGETRVVRGMVETGKGIAYEATHEVGVYRYRSDSMSPKFGVFAVNVDARESRLERIAPEDLQTMFEVPSLYFVKSYKEMAEIMGRLRKGIELWNVLLLIVIAIAVMECFMANRTRPVQVPEKGEAKRVLRSF